jgi:hypothetical protein
MHTIFYGLQNYEQTLTGVTGKNIPLLQNHMHLKSNWDTSLPKQRRICFWVRSTLNLIIAMSCTSRQSSAIISVISLKKN